MLSIIYEDKAELIMLLFVLCKDTWYDLLQVLIIICYSFVVEKTKQ